MPYLENECERKLLEDTTQRALELGESMARAEMEGFEGIAGTVLSECSLASCSEVGHHLASKQLILKLDLISLLVILLLSLQH